MNTFIYTASRLILCPLIKLIYKPKIVGQENIIENKGLILCGNHTSYLDSFILGCATKRNLHYIVKKELHKGFNKLIFKYAGTIPVDRKTKNNTKATEAAVKLLKKNKIIVIFPEGTINKTKNILLPLKYGAVSLAKKSKAYIVPFAITGKFKPFKKGLQLTFGAPYEVKGDLVLENKILEKKVENLINYEK